MESYRNVKAMQKVYKETHYFDNHQINKLLSPNMSPKDFFRMLKQSMSHIFIVLSRDPRTSTDRS